MVDTFFFHLFLFIVSYMIGKFLFGKSHGGSEDFFIRGYEDFFSDPEMFYTLSIIMLYG